MTALLCSSLLILGLAGCAAGRSELDVWVPPVAAANSKQAVTIVEIRDLREFTVESDDPKKPSLAAPGDLDNADKTARTIGRKSNSYGARMGEITLPEGQTVAGLVRQAATSALQDKGYVVVADASQGVLPVSIDIEQFWAWFRPGAFEATLQFETRLRIYGPEVFDYDTTRLQVGAYMQTGMASESDWSKVIQHGLDSLVVRLKEEIEPAGQTPSVATVGAVEPAPMR